MSNKTQSLVKHILYEYFSTVKVNLNKQKRISLIECLNLTKIYRSQLKNLFPNLKI